MRLKLKEQSRKLS